MLYLIGLGIGDENDLTLRGIEAAKKSACFIDMYTTKWLGDIKKIEKLIGKKIEAVNRSDLEEDIQNILNISKSGADVAIFVGGDPLVATTHIDIVLEAKKRDIAIQIIHNSSIYSAIAETGLQIYKFGKTATIPHSKQIQSVKDSVETNKKQGLHTLLLLDLNPEMSLKEGLEILREGSIVNENEKVVVSSRLGSKDSKIHYKMLKSLTDMDISGPCAIIIPGKLHFKEKEYLDNL